MVVSYFFKAIHHREHGIRNRNREDRHQMDRLRPELPLLAKPGELGVPVAYHTAQGTSNELEAGEYTSYTVDFSPLYPPTSPFQRRITVKQTSCV